MKLSIGSLLLVLGTISSVIAFPTGGRPFRAPRERVRSLATRTESTTGEQYLTNAQRFKAGLPPLPPRFKIPGSPTRRQQVSAVPVSGLVTAYDLSGPDPVVLGSLSRALNSDGCFGLGSAMEVSTSYTPPEQSGRQVRATNVASAYAFLGAAAGGSQLSKSTGIYSACLTMVDGQGGTGNGAIGGANSQDNIWRVVKDPVFKGKTYQVTALFAAWNNGGGDSAANFLYDTGLQRFVVSVYTAAEYTAHSGYQAIDVGFTVG